MRLQEPDFRQRCSHDLFLPLLSLLSLMTPVLVISFFCILIKFVNTNQQMTRYNEHQQEIDTKEDKIMNLQSCVAFWQSHLMEIAWFNLLQWIVWDSVLCLQNCQTFGQHSANIDIRPFELWIQTPLFLDQIKFLPTQLCVVYCLKESTFVVCVNLILSSVIVLHYILDNLTTD